MSTDSSSLPSIISRKRHSMLSRLDKYLLENRTSSELASEGCKVQHILDSTHEFYDHVTEKRIKLQALKDNSQIFVQSEEKVHPAPSEDNTASHTSHGHIGIAFKQKPPKYTISKPFSFEPRETAILEARSKREKLAYDHIRELANSFRAQPMPVGSPDPLPPRRSYTPTRPKPFRFKTDDRIINHSRRKESETFQPDSSSSSINSISDNQLHRVLYSRPFEPQPSKKEPTLPQEFELMTRHRAHERAAFDIRVSTINSQKEAEVKAVSLIKGKEEAKLVRIKRNASVHRPEPIRRYKNVDISGTKPPLTKPKSPNFVKRPVHKGSSTCV